MIRYRSVIRNPQRISPVGMLQRSLISTIVAAFAYAASASAQTPSPSVSTGFGVDTTVTDVRNIVSLYVPTSHASILRRGRKDCGLPRPNSIDELVMRRCIRRTGDSPRQSSA